MVNPDSLSGFQRDLLLVINIEGPCNGQHISSEIEAFYGGAEISSGRLYPALDELETSCLIEVTRSEAARHGHEYRITDRGFRLLNYVAIKYRPAIGGGKQNRRLAQ